MDRLSEIRTLLVDNERGRSKFDLILIDEYFELVYPIIKKNLIRGTFEFAIKVYQEVLFRIPSKKYLEVITWLDRFVMRRVMCFCKIELQRLSEDFDDNLTIISQELRINLTYEFDRIALQMDLDSAIQTLSIKQRKVFLLHYYYGYKYSEIPSKLGEAISVGSVRQLIFRAKKNLRKDLKFA